MTADEERSTPLEVTQRTDPPASTINDSIVVLTSAGAALMSLLFAGTLLSGGPLALYGSALAAALLLLAVAVRRYFTGRFPDITAVEPRYPGSESPDAAAPTGLVQAVGPRRTFLSRMLLAAAGFLGIGLLAPIPSLGPSPGDTLRRTRWAPGTRLVTSDGEPVRPDEVAIGGLATIWPEDAIGHERSSVLLIRLQEGPKAPTVSEWVVQGLVAYSKVCTHAGCPVALFRERDTSLFCPCHQSTFDVSRGATPTFGPAARALPQLPLGVDDAGYLIALDDFAEPVGPALPRG